jgi:hypothetical protein
MQDAMPILGVDVEDGFGEVVRQQCGGKSRDEGGAGAEACFVGLLEGDVEVEEGGGGGAGSAGVGVVGLVGEDGEGGGGDELGVGVRGYVG